MDSIHATKIDNVDRLDKLPLGSIIIDRDYDVYIKVLADCDDESSAAWYLFRGGESDWDSDSANSEQLLTSYPPLYVLREGWNGGIQCPNEHPRSLIVEIMDDKDGDSKQDMMFVRQAGMTGNTSFKRHEVPARLWSFLESVAVS